MLPSTGYFKSIICPFYENGCCDRPYCHFKHLRRDDSTTLSLALPTAQATTAETSQTGETSAVGGPPQIHYLVNEAVKKLLENQEVGDTKTMTDKIVAQVVEQLKPTIAANPTTKLASTPSEVAPAAIGKHIGVPSCVTKPAPCVYNPTPISELKKRHIPVPVYMPTRESKVAVKRKSSTDTTIKSWPSMLRESTNSHATEMIYKPTAIINSSQEQDSSKTYVPTLRSDNSSSNSYDDGNSNDYMPKVKEAYYPKSKKRREEYVPKKVKAPLKSVQQLDDTVLDEFGPEFDMIDEILTSTSTTTAATTTTAMTNESSAIVANEDSDDLYEVEPKFSDDEDDVQEVPETPSTKEVQTARNKIDDEGFDDVKENKNNVTSKIEVHTSRSKSRRTSSHKSDSLDEKSSNSGSSKNKEKPRRNSIVDLTDSPKEKDKKKPRRESSKTETKKEESENRKKDHKSSGKNNEKSNNKDSKEKSDCKDKNKPRSSSARDKHRSSSSNKDRDRSKDSHSSDTKKETSRKSKETSRSCKDKVPSSKSDVSKSRSKSRHEKSSSSSSRSKSNDGKVENAKSTERKSSSRSRSHKSSKPTEKKLLFRKESSSETSLVEHEDNSDSTFENKFMNEELMETSDSDHDVEEECLKIFQEYEPSDHPKGVTVREVPKPEIEEHEDVGRKRVAHPSANESVVRAHNRSEAPRKEHNPQQRLYDRWRAMKDAAAEKAAAFAAKHNISMEIEKTSKKQASSSSEAPRIKSGNTMSKAAAGNTQVNGNGKLRIAHVPYAMALALKKKKVTETAKAAMAAKTAALEAKTAAQTSKGLRVAHIPQVVPQLVAPEPLPVTTQKFPLTVRQYYVNLMHVICVQIYTNGEDAGQRALREELACHDRCKALAVYKNSCMLATHRLRKEVEQGTNVDDSLPSASGIVSHNAVLAGKSKGSWSVEKTKKSVMDYRGTALYERLKKWIASEQQLRDNGFPRSHPDGPKGRAKVYSPSTRYQSIISKVPNERYCCRCNKPYMVNKHGMPVIQQNCIYHWGRKFTFRGESKYTCCQQYGFASGCADGKNHVWEHVDYENLRGYVKTLPKDIAAEEQGVFALDCEMSYTTQGLELTRVTVINDDCNTIYETLVMPENPILDYNTRFSGITEENMVGVKTTLLDVQATLLTMFSENTILIGHSLESDFKALKLIHDTVVDTSMMFPHKNGPPHKRALRNLCSEYLRKIIQNEVGGHDSTEDAVACMDLIHWKVKEEAKLQ